jgi:hypothetical protein
MDFLITEGQLKFLLESEKNSKLTSNMKELHSFTVNLVNKVRKKFELNFKFLVTWGTAIGGLVAPLDNFIREGNLNLSDDSIALVLVGVACTYFYQNKKELKKILDKIEEEGLTELFKKTLSEAEVLRKEFAVFLGGLNLTLGATVEMVHYAFIIPIIHDLIRFSHGESGTWETAEMIVERLLASGVVLISGQILIEVISKIVKRLKRF